MVNIPEFPAQNTNHNNGTELREHLYNTFGCIRNMKKILFGTVPAITRIDEEKMLEIKEYLSPGNEEEFVGELINNRFSWIIHFGSVFMYNFYGSNSINRVGCKVDTEEKAEWRKNPRVPEFIADVGYEFFQLLLRNPEAHRKARNCNHLFCSFWPYAVWAYRQILEENLEKNNVWTFDMEKLTKAVWSSYNFEPHYRNRHSYNNVDVFKRSMIIKIKDAEPNNIEALFTGVNLILDKFRTVAFDVMDKTGTPRPKASILYYDLKRICLSERTYIGLWPIGKNNPMSLDDQILLKSELESDMWQAETNLLIQQGIYERSGSLSYLETVCQGFFS